MPTIQIDSQTVTVPEGTTVLQAARQLGIDIPTLCHIDGIDAQNSCMVCVVKLAGSPRMRPACSLRVTDGMVVESETDEVSAARRTAIELLLSDHAGDCIAPCQNNCPAHMDVPLMMQQIIEDDLAGAIQTVKADIPLPAVLGRICPAPCEGNCRRKASDAPVGVCLLKRYVADEDLGSAKPYLPPRAASTGKRVAIVGAGPTGLSAAYYLQLLGHDCAILDAHPDPGGAMRYGIDRETLPLDILDGEIDTIRKLGAHFAQNWQLGRDASLDDLRRDNDVVLLATGFTEDQNAALGVTSSKRGVTVDGRTWQTNIANVFAAGGAVRKTRLAVRSVAEAKAAAQCIDRYLNGVHPAPVDEPFSIFMGKLDEQELRDFMLDAAASDAPRITPEGGLGRGFTHDEAVDEAGRCMQCGCNGNCGCDIRQLATRYRADIKRFRGTRRRFTQAQRHGGVLFELGKCISCGLCIAITRARGERLGLTFVGRGFDIQLSAPLNATLSEGMQRTAQECVQACPTAALRIEPAEQLIQVGVKRG